MKLCPEKRYGPSLVDADAITPVRGWIVYNGYRVRRDTLRIVNDTIIVSTIKKIVVGKWYLVQ